jgi:hypothetical protein
LDKKYILSKILQMKTLTKKEKMMKRMLMTALILVSSLSYGQTGGYALSFDGTDDYVNTNYTTDLTSFTVECWVKGDQAPGSTEVAGVIHRQNNYEINWDHTGAEGRGAAVIHVGGQFHFASFGTLEANIWYHLAATYNGEDFISYKNGELITTNSTPSGDPTAENKTLKIGAHASVPDDGGYFGGDIDEVRIWSTARSQEDIQSTMYKVLAANEDNLVAYYKMSDGSGTTLTDNSSNTNNGALNNDVAWADDISEQHPYDLDGDGKLEVKNEANLVYLSQNSGLWSKNFEQTANISFNADETTVDWDGDGVADGASPAGWSPIGNSTTNFTGDYNGQNFTINNLYINRTATEYVGLFGYVYGSVIQNIGLNDVNITGNAHTGGLLGYSSNSSTITNCFSTGSVD